MMQRTRQIQQVTNTEETMEDESGALESMAMPLSSGLSFNGNGQSPREPQGAYQQFVFEDQRQVHFHAPSPDPGVIAAASSEVFFAREQAAQAVVEARSQTMDLREQAVRAIAEA